jgi:hypothetical protein
MNPFSAAQNLKNGAIKPQAKEIKLLDQVKNLDFDMLQIAVRRGKGDVDRLTLLPASLKEPLQKHLTRVKKLHDQDLARGFGQVYMPMGL